MKKPLITTVIPLFNEEENFAALTERLQKLIQKMPFEMEVVLVNDGSSDNTPFLMEEYCMLNQNFVGVFLSRNYGHQIAVSAGLSEAQATEAVFILDGDLQDPPELLPQFYEKLKEGYDVVYGVRKKRKESALKKLMYWGYYRILSKISKTDVQLDSGDFALISRRVVNIIVNMGEKSRYLRGLRAWVGFKQYGLVYERQARFAGEAKYTFKALFRLAYDGIFNFSDFPIKLLTRIGFSVLIVSILYLFYIVIIKFLTGDVPQGFTTTIFFITFFGGFNLFAFGLIGEYVLRIYQQVQDRPLFITDRVIRKSKIEVIEHS